MTKKLEDTFNLPNIEDFEIDQEFDTDDLIKTAKKESRELKEAISNSEKIDTAIGEVNGFEQHDREMDEISQKAISMFEELKSLGMQVSDAHAARVFEVASSTLKTALEARDSKTNRKLKQLDLMIKKQKLDNDKPDSTSTTSSGTSMTREELLDTILNTPVDINTTRQ